MAWEAVQTHRLTHDLLESLFANDIGAIRVPGFIPKPVCDLAVRGIHAFGIDYYKDVYPRIGRIGITQFEHQKDVQQKLEYFKKAPQADINRQEVFRQSGDLLITVITTIQEAWG